MVVQTPVAVKRAIISVSGSGDNELVALVTGEQIKVMGLVIVAASAVTVQFESSTSGNYLTGAIPLTTDDLRFVLPVALPGYHWFETVAGENLNLILGAGVQVSGCLVYYEEA